MDIEKNIKYAKKIKECICKMLALNNYLILEIKKGRAEGGNNQR